MALRGTAGQANTTSSTTVTVDVSGISIQNGDIVLLVGISGGSASSTQTYPSGFGAISTLTNIAMTTEASTMWCAYKVASGEPTTYTVTSSINDFHTMQCRVYSGRSTISPITAVAQSGPGVDGPLPIAPSLTGLTAAAGDDIIQFLGVSSISIADTYSFTPTSGYINAVNTPGTTVGNSPSMAGANNLNVSAGATGNLSTSMSDTHGGNVQWGGYVIALANGIGPTATVAWIV